MQAPNALLKTMTSHMQHGKNEYSEVSHLQYDKKTSKYVQFFLRDACVSKSSMVRVDCFMFQRIIWQSIIPSYFSTGPLSAHSRRIWSVRTVQLPRLDLEPLFVPLPTCVQWTCKKLWTDIQVFNKISGETSNYGMIRRSGLWPRLQISTLIIVWFCSKTGSWIINEFY